MFTFDNALELSPIIYPLDAVLVESDKLSEGSITVGAIQVLHSVPTHDYCKLYFESSIVEHRQYVR